MKVEDPKKRTPAGRPGRPQRAVAGQAPREDRGPARRGPPSTPRRPARSREVQATEPAEDTGGWDGRDRVGDPHRRRQPGRRQAAAQRRRRGAPRRHPQPGRPRRDRPDRPGEPRQVPDDREAPARERDRRGPDGRHATARSPSARRHEEAGAWAPASCVRGDRPGSVALGGLVARPSRRLAPRHARPWRRPARPSRCPSRPASPDRGRLPGFAAAHASGVTVVQSIVASGRVLHVGDAGDEGAVVAEAVGGRHLGRGRHERAVGVLRAVESVSAVSACLGRVLGIGRLRVGRLGLRRFGLGGLALVLVGARRWASPRWGRGRRRAGHGARPRRRRPRTGRARRRRRRGRGSGGSGRTMEEPLGGCVPVTKGNDRRRRGVRGTSVLGRPDHGGRTHAPRRRS